MRDTLHHDLDAHVVVIDGFVAPSEMKDLREEVLSQSSMHFVKGFGASLLLKCVMNYIALFMNSYMHPYAGK